MKMSLTEIGEVRSSGEDRSQMASRGHTRRILSAARLRARPETPKRLLRRRAASTGRLFLRDPEAEATSSHSFGAASRA